MLSIILLSMILSSNSTWLLAVGDPWKPEEDEFEIMSWIIKAKAVRRGFTLVEILSVLVIIGILVAVAAPKFINLSDSVKKKCIYAGIAEYNGREKLLWARLTISGEYDDGNELSVAILNKMDPYLDGDDVLADDGDTGSAGPGEDWYFNDNVWSWNRNTGRVDTQLEFGKAGKRVAAKIHREPATLEYSAVWTVTGDATPSGR